jgi:hypothetical protein
VVTLASGLRLLGRLDEARVLLERFRSPDASGTPAVIRAEGLAELAAALVFAGAIEEAGPLLEQALSTLELEEATALANALVTRSVYLLLTHRFQEGDGVLRHALMLAEQLDVPSVALRARLNLAQVRLERDQLSEAVAEANEGLALARERGDRALERRFLTQLQAPLVMLGRWDELPSSGAAMLSGEIDAAAVMAAAVLSEPAAARGDEELLGRARALAEQRRESSYVDVRVCALTVLARDALEHGAADRAVALMQEAIANEGLSGDNVKVAYALGVDAAIALGDERAIMELETFVDAMQRARATPLLRAGRARLRAERLHRGGDEEATKRHEDEAIGLLRSVGARPQLARALLERSRRRDDPEALAEARAIYTELGATRWLARIDESSEVPA